jgi:hypothetical protein
MEKHNIIYGVPQAGTPYFTVRHIYMSSINLKYSMISAIAFSIAGASALLLTDLIAVPRAPGNPISFYYSSNLILLVSASLVPGCVAYLGSFFWLSKKLPFLKAGLA